MCVVAFWWQGADVKTADDLIHWLDAPGQWEKLQLPLLLKLELEEVLPEAGTSAVVV